MQNQIAEIPKGIFRVRSKGKTYFYAWRGGPRIDSEPGTSDFDSKYSDIIARSRGADRLEGPHRHAMKEYLCGENLPRARKRARQYGFQFELDSEFLSTMLAQQQWRCAVTSLPLSMSLTGAKNDVFRYPFRPSIDRIDSSVGYTKVNVRIVAYAVNVALNEWGEDVLVSIARGLVARLDR